MSQWTSVPPAAFVPFPCAFQFLQLRQFLQLVIWSKFLLLWGFACLVLSEPLPRGTKTTSEVLVAGWENLPGLFPQLLEEEGARYVPATFQKDGNRRGEGEWGGIISSECRDTVPASAWLPEPPWQGENSLWDKGRNAVTRSHRDLPARPMEPPKNAPACSAHIHSIPPLTRPSGALPGSKEVPPHTQKRCFSILLKNSQLTSL